MIINDGMKAFMLARIETICEHYPQLQFKKVNTDKDHIHLLVSIPPSWSVSKVVNIIKTNTARNLKAEFPFLKEVYWGTDSIWSEGYFVSTVGINEEIIKRYIENQGQADAEQTNLTLV
jgi:putative transposase